MDRQIKVVAIILAINFSLVPFVSNHYAYFLPRTHDFVIHETGITNSTLWGIKIMNYQNGIQKEVSVFDASGTSLSVSLPYGYYHYYIISPSGYDSNITGADFQLSSSGFAPQASVGFLKVHPIYFNETNLPSGASWQVSLNSQYGNVKKETSESSLMIPEPSGNYTYSVKVMSNSSSANTIFYELPEPVFKNGLSFVRVGSNPASQNINFTGRSYMVQINISADFQVNSGNINGIGIQIDGTTLYSQFVFANLSYSSVSMYLPNGTYQYYTKNVFGYTIYNGTGFIVVNGGPSFATITYRYQSQSLG